MMNQTVNSKLRENLPIVLFGLAFLSIYSSSREFFYLPIYPGYFFLQTFTVLLFCYCLFSYWHALFVLPRFFIYPALLLLWGFACTCWCAKGWIAADGLRRLVTWVFFMAGLCPLLASHRRLRENMWNVVLAALGLLALFYLWVRMFYLSENDAFYFLFGNPNMAGCILGFACVFSLIRSCCRFKDGNKRSGAIDLATGLLFAASAITSRSKGAMLAIVIAFFISLLLMCRRKSRAILCAILLAELVTVAALQLGGVDLWQNISDRVWPSLEIRMFTWQGAWNMICSSPLRFLFGWGPGNFFPNFPDFQDPRIYTATSQAPLVIFPHNFSLETFVEYGAVGLGLLLSLLGKSLLMARSLWRSGNGSKRANAMGCFAGMLMIIIHGQVSISLSYPQVQVLLGLSISWLASRHKCRKISWDDHLRLRRCFQALSLCALVASVVLWKLCAWDSLCFHYEYKKASRVYNKALSSKTDLPGSMACARALSVMTGIHPPLCENYYTCHWRNKTGSLFIRYPYWPEQVLPVFLRLESLMPSYGFFLLNRASLAAKRRNAQETNHYFAKFACHNPFAPQLWIQWYHACYDGNADRECMSRVNRQLRKRYGREIVLLLGKALTLDLSGEKDRAKRLMRCVYRQSEKRHLDQRADNIAEFARFYLQNHQK